MRSFIAMLGGNSNSKSKSKTSLAENVRERRDDKSERAAAEAADTGRRIPFQTTSRVPSARLVSVITLPIGMR